MFITFDTLDQFMSVGLTRECLANKIHKKYSATTMLLPKDPELEIGLGLARFDIYVHSAKIVFVEMIPELELCKLNVIRLEERIARLECEIHHLKVRLAPIVLSDSESD